VLSWSTIIYGATMSAGLTAVVVSAVDRMRDRRPSSWLTVAMVAAVSAFAGPLAWNAILHRVHGDEFFVDAPIKILPASWQDTGSGVFTLAVATMLLGVGPLARRSGRRVAFIALVAALVAFAVDVYLY
jgi:hypothetical protein